MYSRLICTDVTQGINLLEDGSVNTCITSPPYWGLRDYGTAKWQGGNSVCQHKGKYERTNGYGSLKQSTNQGANFISLGDCLCGAIRVDNQLGIEQTPEEYVDKIVDIFRQVKRVLCDDGTVWLNLGDSYYVTLKGLSKHSYLKPKDLCGIPWLVAIALQKDGWYLRSDIIWNKPNVMPESVLDRPTRSYEHIFLLSKQAKYYYDYEAIKEPAQNWGTRDRSNLRGGTSDPKLKHYGLKGKPDVDVPLRNKRDVWVVNNKGLKNAHFAVFPEKLIEPCVLAGCPENGIVFDLFSGSGTTGVVALNNSRNYTGIELNPEYIELSRQRILSSCGVESTIE